MVVAVVTETFTVCLGQYLLWPKFFDRMGQFGNKSVIYDMTLLMGAFAL